MKRPKKELLRAVVTDDPLRSLTRPVNLQITAQRFALQQMELLGGLHGVTSLSSFNGTALSVSFRTATEQHTIGSAALVHPGLAITAKHVLADWMGDVVAERASIVCEAPRDQTLLLWDVERVTTLPNADLALLSLRGRSALPAGNNFCVCRITTRLPRIGEALLICGFVPRRAVAQKASSMNIAGAMHIGHGKVTDVWPVSRDSVMLPSTSFAVHCPAFGGMSGGAVFDAVGDLVAVLSSSLDGDDIAYCTHVWPALVGSHGAEAWDFYYAARRFFSGNHGRKV
ncbi:MAG: serine protease [Burkholderiales bacterium]|nr:MAG: serine protease [Burkholderiales bacterium]